MIYDIFRSRHTILTPGPLLLYQPSEYINDYPINASALSNICRDSSDPIYLSLSFFLFRVFSSEDKSSLFLTEFLTAVGMLKFRGTSSLFRLQKSAVKYDAVRNPHPPVSLVSEKVSSLMFEKPKIVDFLI